MTFTIEQIRGIAAEIIADTEWVNDSETISEHAGMVNGLEILIEYLEDEQ